jgi:hypothetical protein
VAARVIEERQRIRQHGRRAGALQRTRGNERRGVGGEPAGERGKREDPNANGIHAPGAEAVAEHAGREHEYREHKRVGVDHPLQARHVGVQVGAESRERDVHDGHVELRDDEADAHGRDNARERGRK